MEVAGQFSGAGSLLPPSALQGLSSGHRTGRQMLFSAEPSCQPFLIPFTEAPLLMLCLFFVFYENVEYLIQELRRPKYSIYFICKYCSSLFKSWMCL